MVGMWSQQSVRRARAVPTLMIAPSSGSPQSCCRASPSLSRSLSLQESRSQCCSYAGWRIRLRSRQIRLCQINSDRPVRRSARSRLRDLRARRFPRHCRQSTAFPQRLPRPAPASFRRCDARDQAPRDDRHAALEFGIGGSSFAHCGNLQNSLYSITGWRTFELAMMMLSGSFKGALHSSRCISLASIGLVVELP